MMALDDLKYAVRLLSKKSGFTVLTTLVMATGLGLSVYLFSFLHGQVYRHLPFENGDTLVQISSSSNGARNQGLLNLHDYNEIRTAITGLTEFGAFRNLNFNVAGRDGAKRYNAAAAEPNMFQLTRTQPILGRGFTEAENQPGAERVVVIGYEVWQNQFGKDSQVLDQTLRINGQSHRIIGVMPEGYFFPAVAEMWVPLRESAAQVPRDSAGSVFGLAHIKDGASMKEINRELTLVMQRLAERFPETNNGTSAYIEFIPRLPVGDGVAIGYSLYIIAILILVLASINVGNLLLSRAIERRKEMAIRVALGAPKGRLISQMLWESIIICGVGGIIGILAVAWGLEITQAISESYSVDRPPFWLELSLDSFTIGLALSFLFGAILITGFLPIWQNSRVDFNAVLRDGTRGAQGRKAGRLNRVLVISEIFVSLTVLIAASVMTVVNYKAIRADYGADTGNTLTAQALLSEFSYDTPQKRVEFAKALESRLENSAGIGDVMIATALPGTFAFTPMIALEGKEYTEDRGYPQVNYVSIMPGSLEKLGVSLKQGRYFNSGDDGLDKRTVIVTESFAERYFANESPIGRRLRIVEPDGNTPDWFTIVGIVEHTIQGPSFITANRETPSVFRPFTQAPSNEITIAVRMKADRSEVLRTLRSTMQSIDPELPAYGIETYTDKIGRHTNPLKFITTVFLLFGIAAAVLASSGIYGVISNAINQRTQEIGVKRALGATEQRITREFLKTGFKQLLWGGIPGLLVGSAMGFGMVKVLPITGPDLLVITIGLTTFIGCAVMFATYLPTTRALKMEPSQALRFE